MLSKLSYFIIKVYYFKFLIKVYFKILILKFAFFFNIFFLQIMKRFFIASVFWYLTIFVFYSEFIDYFITNKDFNIF